MVDDETVREAALLDHASHAESAVKRLLGRPVADEFHAPQHPLAAQLADDRQPRRKLTEPRLEIRALQGSVLDEPLALDNAYDGECRRTGDGVVLVREAVREPSLFSMNGRTTFSEMIRPESGT